MHKRFPRMCAAGSVSAVVILAAFYLCGSAAQDGKDPAKKVDGAGVAVTVTPSRVAAVTVYPVSAMVTREADVPAGKGIVELTISPLPAAAVISSLNAEGSEGHPRADDALPFSSRW